jgi:CRP-like cAMP-binding protein
MPTAEDFAASIEQRLVELNDEIAQLEGARRALVTGRAVGSRSAAPRTSRDGGRSAGAAKPGVSRRTTQVRTSRRGRRRRRAAGLSAEQVESLISGAEALSTTDIAARIGADRERVLSLLRELEAAGRVRRSGMRRSTRWHAITDEDRIPRAGGAGPRKPRVRPPTVEVG